MPRTKGSKNHTKSDIASQIAEKQSVIQTLTAEVEEIQKDIEEKKAEKEVTTLEAKKAKEDAKAAEEAKKAEAESVVKRLLASGMSADEILERLK